MFDVRVFTATGEILSLNKIFEECEQEKRKERELAMKHGKRPTRAQKILIKSKGLNPANWLVVINKPKVMHIVNKNNGTKKIIEKGLRGKQECTK